MRIGHFRKTSLHVHPLFPAICLTYLLGGQGKVLLIYLLTLFCHECGHILMACHFRLSVRRLELTPFGGSMQIDEAETLPARQSLALSAGGVCVNALLLPPLIALFIRTGSLSCLLCVTINLWMLVLNLLPVLPLDGGRMLLAVLAKRLDRAAAFRTLLMLGRAFCALLLFDALLRALRGESAMLRLTLACYLLYASALEERTSVSRYLAAYLSNRHRVERSGALPVQHLCASGDITISALLSHLHGGAYHLVEVLDPLDTSRRLGVLDEEALLSALMEQPLATLSSLAHK